MLSLAIRQAELCDSGSNSKLGRISCRLFRHFANEGLPRITAGVDTGQLLLPSIAACRIASSSSSSVERRWSVLIIQLTVIGYAHALC